MGLGEHRARLPDAPSSHHGAGLPGYVTASEDRRQRQLCLGFIDPVLVLSVYHDKRLFAKSLQLSSLIVLVLEELSLCV